MGGTIPPTPSAVGAFTAGATTGTSSVVGAGSTGCGASGASTSPTGCSSIGCGWMTSVCSGASSSLQRVPTGGDVHTGARCSSTVHVMVSASPSATASTMHSIWTVGGRSALERTVQLSSLTSTTTPAASRTITATVSTGAPSDEVNRPLAPRSRRDALRSGAKPSAHPLRRRPGPTTVRSRPCARKRISPCRRSQHVSESCRGVSRRPASDRHRNQSYPPSGDAPRESPVAPGCGHQPK